MIHQFGQNSFVTHKGLIERTERAIYEDANEKALRSIRRWMNMPRDKRHRLTQRYYRWMMHKIKSAADRDDPISPEDYHARIALQKHWNKES